MHESMWLQLMILLLSTLSFRQLNFCAHCVASGNKFFNLVQAIKSEDPYGNIKVFSSMEHDYCSAIREQRHWGPRSIFMHSKSLDQFLDRLMIGASELTPKVDKSIKYELQGYPALDVAVISGWLKSRGTKSNSSYQRFASWQTFESIKNLMGNGYLIDPVLG